MAEMVAEKALSSDTLDHAKHRSYLLTAVSASNAKDDTEEEISNRKKAFRTMCNRTGANNNTLSTEISKKIMSEDGLSLNDAGRGSQSGYVRCSLCNVKSRKMYAYGRGLTAHLAAIHPNEDHVQAVLDSKATLTKPGMDKQGKKAVSYMESLPPACLAARYGKLEELQKLHSSNQKSIAVERDKFGANALDWAAGGGHLDCVQFLIPIMPLSEYNKQPIKRRDGKSCLHWSCRNGNIETTKYLIENLYIEASTLATLGTGDGTTPMQLAAFGGHIHILQWLHRTYGPTSPTPVPNLTTHHNTWGCYPEHFACMSPACTPELLHYFVDTVYNGNTVHAAQKFFMAVNTEGMTPVHKWLLHIGKGTCMYVYVYVYVCVCARVCIVVHILL